MNKIYFVSGVNGVGKSAVIPYLKSLLPESKYEVHDFDARGVPENADRAWRISETKYWIGEGTRLASEGKSMIICGFIKPSDEQALISAETPEIVMILLDAKPEIIRQRLIGRYTKNGFFDENQKVIGKPIDEFINGNVWFVGQMKDAFEKDGYPIIDTSNLTPEEVAREVVKIIAP